VPSVDLSITSVGTTIVDVRHKTISLQLRVSSTVISFPIMCFDVAIVEWTIF
jgi:hypothetical protein